LLVNRANAAALLAALLALPGASPAQVRDAVVIYRCTDAVGNVTLQNDVACPAGTRQERERIDVPPPMPAYVPREERMPDVVAAEAARQDAHVADALPEPVPRGERKPPPALYRCATWDDLHYFTEDAKPQEHCAPLQVVGIGAAPLAGAATACEQVADTCAAVPAEALCKGWKQRVEEAEFRWKFAGNKGGDAPRLEYETLRATYDNSTCAR
jgi:hypothetical protein